MNFVCSLNGWPKVGNSAISSMAQMMDAADRELKPGHHGYSMPSRLEDLDATSRPPQMGQMRWGVEAAR